MAGMAGFEPAHLGVKVPCLKPLGYTPIWYFSRTQRHHVKVVPWRHAHREGLELVGYLSKRKKGTYELVFLLSTLTTIL